MANHISIVSVPVADQQRAKKFYVEKLGCKVTMEAPDAMGPGRHWIMVEPSGGGAQVALVNWMDTMPAGSLRGLVVSSSDIAADHAALKANGVKVDAIQKAAWGSFATLTDSEGNQLVLHQPG